MFSMFIFQKQLAQQKQLEEVNAAGAIRTLRDAVKSAVALQRDDLVGYPEGVTLKDASEFLPQEYFSGFRVAVRREGAKLSAVIVSPTSLGRYALDNLSAARISSMLGASGGFVPSLTDEPSSTANGTLGLWSLDINEISAEFADPVRIVVNIEFSEEMGGLPAEEKEKILYRTADYGQASNTMITSLFFNDGSKDTIRLDPDGTITNGAFTILPNGSITGTDGTFSGLVTGDDFQTTGGLSVTKLVPQAFYADLANGASIPKPSCPAGFTATVELTPKEIDYTVEIDNTPLWTECECEMIMSTDFNNSYNRSNCPFRINRGGIGTAGIIPCYGDGTFGNGSAIANITKAPQNWSIVSAAKKYISGGVCTGRTLQTTDGIQHYECTAANYYNLSNTVWLPLDASLSPWISTPTGQIYMQTAGVIRLTYRHKAYPNDRSPKPALQEPTKCSMYEQRGIDTDTTTGCMNLPWPTFNAGMTIIMTYLRANGNCPFVAFNAYNNSEFSAYTNTGFPNTVNASLAPYASATWNSLFPKPSGWTLVYVAEGGTIIADRSASVLGYMTGHGMGPDVDVHGNAMNCRYRGPNMFLFYEKDGVIDQDYGNQVLMEPYVDIKAKASVSGTGPWTVVLEGYKKTDAQVYCKRN
ncbi:hypothetical protein FACS1894186_2030 [Alphaproteobacteria bacterium]|nr:hypothetical protein FACS1894186_2030 [Alphaproteobacteria bacterium]